ncbi:uncharacterized protein LOC115882965 [Sitophilus oryzae]|uniref:Uncharacterized protein LOC115882965 n=1 Tax=Sitophilus oryzae TaxID=7048 RepID=A0A6J2Y261_SITOR|nr:uncharacterized protein LOC115882965 [Sitophilus oryzae]
MCCRKKSVDSEEFSNNGSQILLLRKTLGTADITMQYNNNTNLEPIGDANHEERQLQGRFLRILSLTSVQAGDVTYLYVNNDFLDQPPSVSLFEDDVDDEYSSAGKNQNLIQGYHNMFAKIVKSKISDQSSTEHVYIEDIVTKVHLPSEEFAVIETIKSTEKFWNRIWSWIRKKIFCG